MCRDLAIGLMFKFCPASIFNLSVFHKGGALMLPLILLQDLFSQHDSNRLIVKACGM